MRLQVSLKGPQGGHENDLKTKTLQGPPQGAKREPKWRQNGGKMETTMETKWRQNGDKLETKGRQLGDKMGTKWKQNGDKVETKWRQNIKNMR